MRKKETKVKETKRNKNGKSKRKGKRKRKRKKTEDGRKERYKKKLRADDTMINLLRSALTMKGKGYMK